MKRTLTQSSSTTKAIAKDDENLEGLVVAITDISNSQTDKKGKYWTALICGCDQNIHRITKYLSLKTNCSLHMKIVEHFKNNNGFKLTKLKSVGDQTYTATNETMLMSKTLSFTPSCTNIYNIQDIQSSSDGEHVSVICKIIDIGPVRNDRNFVILNNFTN